RPTTTGTGSTTTTVVTVAPTIIGKPGPSTTTMDTAVDTAVDTVRAPRSTAVPEDGPTTTHGFEGLAGDVAHGEQHPPNTPCHVGARRGHAPAGGCADLRLPWTPPFRWAQYRRQRRDPRPGGGGEALAPARSHIRGRGRFLHGCRSVRSARRHLRRGGGGRGGERTQPLVLPGNPSDAHAPPEDRPFVRQVLPAGLSQGSGHRPGLGPPSRRTAGDRR